MTEVVMVERVFEQAVTFEDVQAREDAVASCFQDHGVHAVRSYLSIDRRQMLCLYRAADAESVCIANRQAGMPLLRAWPATVHVAR